MKLHSNVTVIWVLHLHSPSYLLSTVLNYSLGRCYVTLYLSRKYTQRANCIFWVLKCIHGTYRQTLPDLHSTYVLIGPAPSNILHKSELSMDMIKNVCVCVCVYTWQSSWNPNSNTREPGRPQHYHHFAIVIAQEVFFHHLRFIALSFPQNKFDAGLKKCYFCFLKLCNLRTSWIVCTVTTVL